MNVNKVARAIKVPIKQWPGNCYAIACKMVAADLVVGAPVYGLWVGWIATDCLFAGRPFTHHGWIETVDGVVDPTRWVFEGVTPYIYDGLIDDNYDKGGDRVRSAMRGPFPAAKPGEYLAPVPQAVRDVVEPFAEVPQAIAVPQACWLAGLPLSWLGDDGAHTLFTWIVKTGWGAMIPIDNRIEVLGR